jgi:hypothetical protein
LEKVGESIPWKSKEKITVACVCDPILIASFEPEQKKVDLISLPSDFYLEVPGYGWYPASSAYGLGQLAKPPQGARVFAFALSSAIQGPIDYYIKFKDENFSHLSKEKITSLAKKIGEPEGLILAFRAVGWISKNMETNLTLFDIYRLWWEAKNIRINKINYLTLPLNYFEDLILPDGRIVKIFGEQGIGEYAPSFFSDQKILNEKFSLEILNATSKEGIGGKVAKIVEAAGVDVSFIGNYQGLVKKSILEVKKEEKNSVTARRISRLFDLEKQEKKEKGLSEMTLILGEDLSNFF